MTEKELRSKVANWLTSYLGCTEGSAKHKEILSIFNNSKLCSRYTMTVSDAWCATAVSAAFIACGLAGASGSGKLFQCVECSCNNMITKAKTQGIWVENDAYVPKVGDVILYDWQDSGVGDNTGSSDHVGIVYSISGSAIKVIEGNKSNTVAYRTIAVNGKYIRGYITPNYAKFATTVSTNSGTTTSALNRTEKWVGIVNTSSLNVRTWAGTENGKCSFSPLKKNTVIFVCDSVKDKDGVIWYYIKYNGKYGFVSSKYISKQTSLNTSTSLDGTKVDSAASYDKSIAGTYKTTAALNLRAGAGTSKTSICVMPKGSSVKNYGYYTTVSNVKWYYVSYTNSSGKSYIGFCSSIYLTK